MGGVLASLKVTNTKLSENVILFQGAGEAALGIAMLCTMAMVKEGIPQAEAAKKIWLVDSKGLIVKNRPKGGLNEHKDQFAHEHAPVDTLAEAVEQIKPTILIGAAAIGGAFTPAILEKMAENNKKPIIFALSNPTAKAECTAEDAYKYTKVTVIFLNFELYLITFVYRVHAFLHLDHHFHLLYMEEKHFIQAREIIHIFSLVLHWV